MLRAVEATIDTQGTVLLKETINLFRPQRAIVTILDEPIESVTEKKLRPFGLCAGEFTVPDDFDDPLPEDILHLFT